MKAAICHTFLVLLAIIQCKVIQKRFHKGKEFCDWYCPFIKRKMSIVSPACNHKIWMLSKESLTQGSPCSHGQRHLGQKLW